jgi:hypothetical protein
MSGKDLMMTPNNILLHIAERRLRYLQDRLQAAFRTGNHQEASACELLIREYDLLLREAFAQIRSQAAFFLSIESGEAATDVSLQSLEVPQDTTPPGVSQASTRECVRGAERR